MNLRMTVGTALVVSTALLMALPDTGHSIPAFARKYHTTCARCHSVVPRLNNYGWNFKLRGFHVPGDEDTGMMATSEDKSLSLLDQVPLALRLMGNVQFGNAKGMQGTSTLDSEIDLLSAGAIAKRIAYWAEVDVPKNPDGTFSVEIGNVRGIFRDLVRRAPTALNLEVGKFNMDEFGISTGRILTQNPYAIYSVGDALGNFPESDEVQGFNIYGAIGTGIGKGVAATEQKAGKAATVTEEEKKALEKELEGQEAKPVPETPEITATRAVLEALVKKGTLTQEEADQTLAALVEKLGPPPTPPPTAPTAAQQPVSMAKSDYDIRKGLFYQAGLVTRSTDNGSQPQGFARLIYANPHDWWIGPVAYFGSNFIAGTPGFINHFTRLGIEGGYSTGPHRDVAGVSRKAIDLLFAAQYGSDGNAAGSGMRVEHVGLFAEASYIIDDKNLAVIRWDKLHSSQMPGINVNTLTLNFTHYLQRNLKVGVEFVPDLQGNTTTHGRGDQYILFYDFTF